MRTSTMTSRVGATATALLFLGLLLVGCTAPVGPVPDAPSASPVTEATTTTTTAAPAPTPSETPVTPVVDELVLRPTFVELRSAGRVVQQLDYLSPSADAIARFTELFGREPVVSEYEGGNHYPDGLHYEWGYVMLEVQTLTYGWGDLERSLAHPDFVLFFRGPSEGAVGLRAENGSRAGVGWNEITTVRPAEGFMNCFGTPVERERADTPVGSGGASVVAVKDWEGTDEVRWLRAPDVEEVGCA